VRSVFVKILLWFWTSLVLVALALELAITATSTPVEVRVARFSDSVLSSHTREAVAILDRDGAGGTAGFLADLERRSSIATARAARPASSPTSSAARASTRSCSTVTGVR